MTYNTSPATIVAEVSVIVTSVCARTTNIISASSPTNPVVPEVPSNTEYRSWNPTLKSFGIVRLTSTLPVASVIPITFTFEPFNVTLTFTPTTGDPVLSDNWSTGLTSVPLSVLSFNEGVSGPSILGDMYIKTVYPLLSNDAFSVEPS